jgi:hypothetical protein
MTSSSSSLGDASIIDRRMAAIFNIIIESLPKIYGDPSDETCPIKIIYDTRELIAEYIRLVNIEGNDRNISFILATADGIDNVLRDGNPMFHASL